VTVIDASAEPVELAPALPEARGPLSRFVVDALRRPPSGLGVGPVIAVTDALTDDDLHLALYVCYELHYRSFEGVDERWEWEPSLLAFRRRLEDRFEAALLATVPAVEPVGPERATDALKEIVGRGNGPSLSRYMMEQGTLEEFREFAVHRSAYQLKEADPHTWGIPRLSGRAKAALIEIQADEYGGGRVEAMHSTLFADVLDAVGLDSGYGAYLDLLPGVTLATVNLISLFGLHRRWRAALVGHLAVFEMSSVVPMGRYAAAVDRLGLPGAARVFYDVHVEADAHHEIVAAEGLVGGLAQSEPGAVAGILFGAQAIMAVEERFATHLLEAWTAHRSSLRTKES
jgi:hypothetical protein